MQSDDLQTSDLTRSVVTGHPREDQTNDANATPPNVHSEGEHIDGADNVTDSGSEFAQTPVGAVVGDAENRNFDAIFDEPVDSKEDALVRSFLKQKGIDILFEGGMQYASASDASSTTAMSGWDFRPEPTEDWAVDEIYQAASRNAIKVTRADIRRAFQRIASVERQKAKARIAGPLLVALNDDEQERAVAGWMQCEELFEKEGPLCIAVLKHFMWQVKRKLGKSAVTNHLMPIVTCETQGSGKTTFVETLVAPLGDLVSPCVRLADLTDSRSGGIFQYPVVFADDIAPVRQRDIEVLKSVITGKQLTRRRLGTSSAVRYAQSTTLIGTANKTVDELIPDPTGNRRFVSLLFRNGNIARAGDADVWPIVQQLDARLLWRSVDAEAPSPLGPQLAALAKWQETTRLRGEVEQWLDDLDVTSPKIMAISIAQGVKAKPLFDIFKADTGSDLSITKFGNEMTNLLTTRSGVPFGTKIKTMTGTVYPLKKAKSAAHHGDHGDLGDHV